MNLTFTVEPQVAIACIGLLAVITGVVAFALLVPRNTAQSEQTLGQSE